jgi:hypothetical protein
MPKKINPELEQLIKNRKYYKNVGYLMMKKQEWMIEQGYCSESNLCKLGQYHLISAELVIADLLEIIHYNDK